MMTSINPKNVNLNNMLQNEPDIAPNQISNLFQRNNYLSEKEIYVQIKVTIII